VSDKYSRGVSGFIVRYAVWDKSRPYPVLNSSISDDSSLHWHLLVYYCSFIVEAAVLPGLTLWNRTWHVMGRRRRGAMPKTEKSSPGKTQPAHIPVRIPWLLDKSSVLFKYLSNAWFRFSKDCNAP